MADLNVNIDNWKNKLLDMGLRNKMLNYRETKRSTLRILEPGLNSLWNSFVLDEKPLVFPPVHENGETALVPLDYYENLEWEDAAPDSIRVVTNQNPGDCQSTLRNLRDKSKSFMEEQGINVLYLCFGFLQWAEAAHANQAHDAPLILVPVTIKWESILSPFVLELHEDEIVVNPTLLYKLESEFGLSLPNFDLDVPPEAFFHQVEETTAPLHWHILREVGLGMLSFLKINMYQDLERHRADILEHPVVRAICGDSSAVSHDITDVDSYDHDHMTVPMDLFQVVDADASQQDAILFAKRGNSFVLQGPPGTGKSQTITNIIAECLASGKKVLFVSEKMAALDVVYHRLTEANLADFCLVLHSSKANKKQTLEQLGAVLSLAGKKAEVREEAYQSLQWLKEDRDQLNQYAEEVYAVVEPLQKSIYEVNGLLSSVMEYEDLIFEIPDIRKTTAQQYNRDLNLLKRFCDTLRAQTVDYHVNPWRGAAVAYLSNELRHDIHSRGKGLRDELTRLAELFDAVHEELALTLPDTYAGIGTLQAILDTAKEGVPFQSGWIFREDMDALMREVSDCTALQREFVRERRALLQEIQTIQDNDGEIDLRGHAKFTDSALLRGFLSDLEHFKAQDACYQIWQEPADYAHLHAFFEEAEPRAASYWECQRQLSEKYEKEFLDLNYNEIYFRWKTESKSAFKILNSQYRSDKKLIQSMYKGDAKLSDAEILSALSLLRELHDLKAWIDEHRAEGVSVCPVYYKDENTNFDSLRKHIAAFGAIRNAEEHAHTLLTLTERHESAERELKKHYQGLYTGIETDWNAVQTSLQWCRNFATQMGERLSRNERFLEKLSADREAAEKCGAFSERLVQIQASADEDLAWFSGLFEENQNFEEMRLIALIDRLDACCDNFAVLEEWNDYHEIRRQCRENGLEDYLAVLETQNLPKKHIVPVFQKRFFRLWLDSVLPEYPAVANFRHKKQDAEIEAFRQLDRSQFSIAGDRIRCRLIESLPSMDRFTNGVDEISILKKEMKKQRKIMPIRKLFREIPNLIMTLKPCLMMSPLSVSLYLESDSFQFDTVIFDEASQVFTENAIGAIFRGRQVIIAGDSRQLPPTNFFMAASGNNDFDEEDDEEDDSDAYESILDQAALLPERTLRWHYRSRHEHLIAFSNAKIYDGNLITFPSNIDRFPDMGVEYLFVENGFYERGNMIEAQKVAEMIFDHFRKFPNRSLGVITFGVVQQTAIETALRKMRYENPSFEPFFREDRSEPFFVKSLENVQGDERDTIILSIGYGKNKNGVMHMNFGPLSNQGGERRLNVAITRAKYNLKLVGSILPTDLDLSRISTEGPKLLRSYIEFAMRGPESLSTEITEPEEIWHESPFEESVYQFLNRKGYQLATQVGCSGYRIDIAVKHPKLHGRYVLGIECDGATYHSARTARERDRLRQDVLESIGWNIYRIWSTDWIKDPVTEGKRLVDAVENALLNYHEELPQEPVPPQKEAEEKSFLTIEDQPDHVQNSVIPYQFEPYPELNLQNWLHTSKNQNLSEWILYVIETAYPVHLNELYQAAALFLRREKITSVVKNQVISELNLLRSKYIEQDKFYFPASCNLDDLTRIPHRLAEKRTIKQISALELASGMLAVARTCIGATKESLMAETVRAFGYSRSSANISEGMKNALCYLETHHYVKVINRKINVL